MLYDDTVILLFAKAPIAGRVNTRLIPDIGVEEATSLQNSLIHQRLSMLSKAKLSQVILMCALDIQHECFVSCAQKYPVQLVAQSGRNLGERMFNGISAALQTYKYCVVIGTDAPALDEVLIEQAIKILRSDTEVVFVPAEDGGYVLLGMRHAHDVLFKDIDWGSAEVMQQSRHKLKMVNIPFRELASCWDVDRLEDYQRYLAM
jgi:rSAM/selenodomain-associated transferase 1